MVTTEFVLALIIVIDHPWLLLNRWEGARSLSLVWPRFNPYIVSFPKDMCLAL